MEKEERNKGVTVSDSLSTKSELAYPIPNMIFPFSSASTCERLSMSRTATSTSGKSSRKRTRASGRKSWTSRMLPMVSRPRSPRAASWVRSYAKSQPLSRQKPFRGRRLMSQHSIWTGHLRGYTNHARFRPCGGTHSAGARDNRGRSERRASARQGLDTLLNTIAVGAQPRYAPCAKGGMRRGLSLRPIVTG
jgi:hypothetical protein